MKPYRRSRRSASEWVSSSSCLSEILSERWAATVSESLLGSSIWLSETRTSGGTFLFSLTYCSNWVTTVRASASSSRGSEATSASTWACAWKNFGLSMKLSISARALPSTSTLTVPSGSLSSWSTLETVPTR